MNEMADFIIGHFGFDEHLLLFGKTDISNSF